MQHAAAEPRPRQLAGLGAERDTTSSPTSFILRKISKASRHRKARNKNKNKNRKTLACYALP
jgi:hypothetical protein